jgi:hypothetical protein
MKTLSRLREMSLHEIGHRLRERLRIERERLLGHAKTPPVSLKSLAARFYLTPDPAFVRATFPEWVEKAVREADVLCEHRLELLGYGAVDLGSRIDWHRNPVTGVEWPRRFWADYDPVNELTYGDSKVVHELNRHQHLPRLGKAYYLTGDERYAREAIDQIESWIAQNPEGIGINWQSSLEISIRIISWFWTIYFLMPSLALTEASTCKVTQSLFAQLRHVRRYLSVYSSPNTHLIGEAAALFIGGLLLDGTEARQWRDVGADLLAQTIRRQVLDDGVHCELSTCYHCYAADFYLQAMILARRNGFDFPPDVAKNVDKKVEQMLEFVMHVTRPDGVIPQLGDDDGGRALALDRTDYRCYLDGLCTGALLFSRPDFKWQSRTFQEETLWLLGSDAYYVFEALPSVCPEGNRCVFDAAGYTVLRTGWDPEAGHLVFDYGGLGAPTGGHGHADALSLVLFSHGRDLLMDSGTYVYNGAPEWRDYFRSTRAHNTIVADGRDQSQQAGTFQWKSRAQARALPSAVDSVAGEHTGNSVIHRRKVHFGKLGECVIEDELLGQGEHVFEFFFHCPCGVSLAGMEAVEGWISPRYGSRTPANVFRRRVKTAAPFFNTTVIEPFQKGAERCAESAELLTSTPTIR